MTPQRGGAGLAECWRGSVRFLAGRVAGFRRAMPANRMLKEAVWGFWFAPAVCSGSRRSELQKKWGWVQRPPCRGPIKPVQ
jgi:hypothetical protein